MSNFSVCLSVYKGDDCSDFQLALHSIFNQSLMPNEVILVVDGPVSVGIDDVIATYSSNYNQIKVIRLERNYGHAIARRTCINAANNEFVAIMDSDDIALPFRFEKQVVFLELKPDICVCGGQINEFIGNADHIVGRRVVPCEDEEIRHYIKYRCPFNQMTVMMRRSKVLEAGNYQEWYCDEDYYLWIRMMIAGCKFANLPDTLVHVRVGKDMYARRGGLKYFKSEAKLQKYMWDNDIISLPRFTFNVLARLCVQVLMPNWMRGFVFQKLFRK